MYDPFIHYFMWLMGNNFLIDGHLNFTAMRTFTIELIA
jgi:hypothetical protein